MRHIFKSQLCRHKILTFFLGLAAFLLSTGLCCIVRADAPISTFKVGSSEANVVFSTATWPAGKTGKIVGFGFPGNSAALTVSDDGQTVWQGNSTVNQGRFTAGIPVSQCGYYTLEADGAPAVNFAVVPKQVTGGTADLSDPNHRLLLGICTHFGQREMPESSYAVLKNLGVDFVRDEIYWNDVERSKGSYSFIQRDISYVNSLAESHVRLLFVADGSCSFYGPSTPFTPEGDQAYANYCGAVLKRFGNEIDAVEVYNEPNSILAVGSYLPGLKALFSTVRADGFKQPIISVGGAGIGGGMNPSYASEIFKAGAAAYCDGFSQHPYTSPWAPDLGYPCDDGSNHNASMTLALDRSEALLQQSGFKRGGWITEIGWPSPAVVSELKQAAFLARTILVVSSYPHMEGLSTYDFQDDGSDPNNKEHRFGIVRQDMTPKPSYQAFAVAASFLRDKTFVRRITGPDSNLRANIYRDIKGNYWAACWATETTYNETGRAYSSRSDSDAVQYKQLTGDPQVRFQISTMKGASAMDWQGKNLLVKQTMTAEDLPIYINTKLQTDTIELSKISR